MLLLPVRIANVLVTFLDPIKRGLKDATLGHIPPPLSTVTFLDPIKRGLKGHRAVSSHDGQIVTFLDPIKRGLKEH